MGDSYQDALVEKIHEWTYETLNDDAKLAAWKAYGDHRIPSDKQMDAGDVRFNHNTQMLEIYDGYSWFEYKPGLRDTPIPTEKEIALDELFKGTEE